MNKKKLLATLSLTAVMALSAGALTSCDLLESLPLPWLNSASAVTVELSQSEMELIRGESSRLVATVSTSEKAEWASSDEAVVTVQDGRLKAVGAGTATVTASVGDVKATCTITVVDVTVTLDKTTATVERGQTLQLTATASKEGELKWTSSDTSVLTVKDGVITALEEGKATVTVTYGSSACKATCEVTVAWTSRPADYEAIMNGAETDVALPNPGKFVEWHDQSWCGTNVTVTQAEYMNGGAHIAYSGVTEVCWFGMQIFYENASNVAGTPYELSCDITSAQEGDITINGNVVHLVKGENAVKVYYVEGSGASLSMQMGVNGGTVIGENQIVIKNLTFAEFSPEKLTAPTEFSISADRVVTVKDNNGDKVSAYQIIFAKEGKVVNKVTLQSGESFDDTVMEDGEYQVSVVAVGEGKYQDSDPSSVVLTYTVANGGIQYDMENQVATVAVANPGKYYYWTEFSGMENVAYDNGTISFGVVNGGNWYSNQIFFKNPALTTGTRYTLTLSIHASEPSTITLNGTMLGLEEGDNAISIEYNEPATDPSFSMQMGVNGDPGVALTSGQFVLSNIVWTQVGGSVTPPQEGGNETGGEAGEKVPATIAELINGGQGDSTSNPGKLVEWHDQNWCGSNVTVSKAELVDGKAHISYTGATTACWFGMQIFYDNATNEVGKTYVVSLDLNSKVAGEITVNGKVIALEAGDNHIEVQYVEAAVGENSGASLSIQMGVEGKGSVIAENEIVITNLAFAEVV